MILYFKVHSNILHTMLKKDSSVEPPSQNLRMTGHHENVVRALVDYCYLGKVDVDKLGEEHAVKFLQLANYYNISNLESILVNILFQKPAAWFSIYSAAYVFRFLNEYNGYKPFFNKILNILKRYKHEFFFRENK